MGKKNITVSTKSFNPYLYYYYCYLCRDNCEQNKVYWRYRAKLIMTSPLIKDAEAAILYWNPDLVTWRWKTPLLCNNVSDGTIVRWDLCQVSLNKRGAVSQTFQNKTNAQRCDTPGFINGVPFLSGSSAFLISLTQRSSCVSASPVEEALAQRTTAAASPLLIQTPAVLLKRDTHEPTRPGNRLIWRESVSRSGLQIQHSQHIHNDQERASPQPSPSEHSSRERRRHDPGRYSLQSGEEKAKNPGVVRWLVSS